MAPITYFVSPQLDNSLHCKTMNIGVFSDLVTFSFEVHCTTHDINPIALMMRWGEGTW